jgi:hypothetical protein
MKSHFPDDTVSEAHGVTLKGTAHDHDDAMPVPAMQAWVADAEHIKKFDRYE